MNIQALPSLLSVDALTPAATAKSAAPAAAGPSFQELLSKAIESTQDTLDTSQAQTDALLTGQIDNLHDIPIATTKAELALDLVIQVRNKAVDAYNEVMRMQV